MQGWTAFRNGIPLHNMIEPTKQSLLISYDMIPLRGLAETEKRMTEGGIEIKQSVVRITGEGESYHALVPVVNGQLLREILAWASWSRNEDQTLNRTALYFMDRPTVCGDAGCAILRKFFWTPERQKKRKQQRAIKAREVLERSGVTFARIVIEPKATSDDRLCR